MAIAADLSQQATSSWAVALTRPVLMTDHPHHWHLNRQNQKGQLQFRVLHPWPV